MSAMITASDGVRLFVDDQGPRRADAMVFLHEFGGDWRTWDGLAAHFAARRRCIRYAARGFAPSETPDGLSFYGQTRAVHDLRDVVDAVALDRFHLVGCSMGGFTALMFALDAPERLRSLTLIGCSSGPRDDDERARYHAALHDELNRLRTRGGDGAVDWFANDPAYRRMPEKAPMAWRAYVQRLRSQSVPGAVQTLETVHWNRVSLFARGVALARIPVPTNLIYGEEDHPLIAPTNAFLADTLPKSQAHPFAKTGHLVHLEHDRAVQRILEETIAA